MKLSNLFNHSESNGELTHVGIGGFTAFVFTDRSTSRSASLPANTLEDGSFVNDQVVIKPVTISISGVVSDKYIYLGGIVPKIINAGSKVSQISKKMSQVAGLFNKKTAYQLQRISNIAEQISSRLEQVDDFISSTHLFDIFGNKSVSVSEQFVIAMETLVRNRQPLPIETRFKTYPNMIITAFTTREDDKSNALHFSLQAQELRIAETKYVKMSDYMSNPANPNQVAGNVDKGVQVGEKVDNSKAQAMLANKVRQ